MNLHRCEGEACAEMAKFQCPTCVKLKLSGYFHSQECFKANWTKHKLKHQQVLDGVAAVLSGTANTSVSGNPFPHYPFTGSLRPMYPLSTTRSVPTHIQRPDYAEDGIPKSEQSIRGSSQIRVLKPEEIAKMRVVCKLAREVLDIAASHVRPGITTDEIDRIVHEATITRNAYPSPLNYHGFPKSCCTSVNEVICHGIPDQRPLQDGDIVNIDVTLYYHGFHGDLNETYFVGNVDDKGRKLVESTRKCLTEAIKIVRPGARYRDIGDVIQKIAQENGHSVVKTYSGHGIHELFHCPPSIPHYSKNKAVGIMKPGHTFTIEPMINEGTWRDEHWPDNWTAVTADGKRSAQFEHTLLVTETGVEILT